jgi:hypothetical protein
MHSSTSLVLASFVLGAAAYHAMTLRNAPRERCRNDWRERPPEGQPEPRLEASGQEASGQEASGQEASGQEASAQEASGQEASALLRENARLKELNRALRAELETLSKRIVETAFGSGDDEDADDGEVMRVLSPIRRCTLSVDVPTTPPLY